MELRESDKKILELINSENSPQSIKEISEQIGYAQSVVYGSLRKLENEGYITTVGTNRARQYYISAKAAQKLGPDTLENVGKELNNITADAKGSYEDIKEKTEILDKKIQDFDGKMNQFYVNIISIMAVFVAIFALISINIKVVADVATTISRAAIWTCVIIDVSAVAVIGIMLWLLKLIIINPLKIRGDDNDHK